MWESARKNQNQPVTVPDFTGPAYPYQTNFLIPNLNRPSTPPAIMSKEVSNGFAVAVHGEVCLGTEPREITPLMHPWVPSPHPPPFPAAPAPLTLLALRLVCPPVYAARIAGFAGRPLG